MVNCHLKITPLDLTTKIISKLIEKLHVFIFLCFLTKTNCSHINLYTCQLWGGRRGGGSRCPPGGHRGPARASEEGGLAREHAAGWRWRGARVQQWDDHLPQWPGRGEQQRDDHLPQWPGRGVQQRDDIYRSDQVGEYSSEMLSELWPVSLLMLSAGWSDFC